MTTDPSSLAAQAAAEALQAGGLAMVGGSETAQEALRQRISEVLSFHFAPVLAAKEQELERARKRNSELQRRCQQAESACVQFKKDWDKHGGPRGGSFGRALLSAAYSKLEEELAAQEQELERLRKELNKKGEI